jgi:hypothetical protein
MDVVVVDETTNDNWVVEQAIFYLDNRHTSSFLFALWLPWLDFGPPPKKLRISAGILQPEKERNRLGANNVRRHSNGGVPTMGRGGG